MAEDPAVLRERATSLRDRVVALGDKVGSYTSKSEARLRGCSIHVKFENEVDIQDALEFQNLMLHAPELIASLTNTLIAMLDRDPEMA